VKKHTGREVLKGLAISEDMAEPRCAAATIHYMDELVMMEKMMEDMFNMDDIEKVDEPDMKKARANLETDADDLAEQVEHLKEKSNAAEQTEGQIREEL